MEEFVLSTLLSWAGPWLIGAGVYVAVMLSVAGVVHTIATGVLRPLAKLTKSKTDDRYVELAIWWSDGVSDVLREWAVGKWVAGAKRAKRQWEDRDLYPFSLRRWE